MFARGSCSFFLLGFWLLCLLLPLPALAAEADEYSLGVESYRELTLANGLRAVIAVDRRAPRVAVQVEYEVGDALDPPDRRGLARVIGQALPWLTTRHLKLRERERLYEAAGVTFERPQTHVRADTSGVGVEVPVEALELALWIEADRMGFAADGVTSNILRWSIDQAKKELAVPADDSLPLAHFATLGPSHPYGATFSAPRIDDLTTDEIATRLRRFYNPASAVLVVLGDVDVSATEQLITGLFGSLPSAPVPHVSAPSAPSTARPLDLEAPVTSVELLTLWKTAPWFTNDDLGLDVVSALLRRRLKAHDLCEGLNARQLSRTLTSVFNVFCAGPKQSADAFRSAVKTEITTLAEAHVTLAELQGAALDVQRDESNRYEDKRWRASTIASSVLAGHGPRFVENRFKALAALDPNALAAIVRRNLLREPDSTYRIAPVPNAPREGRLTSSTSGARYSAPAATGGLATKDSDVFLRPPAVGATRHFQAPLGLSETLPNGDKLHFLTAEGAFSGSADLFLPFRATARELAEKALLLELINGRLNAPALEQTLEIHGAQVNAFVSDTSLSIHVKAPAKHLAAVLSAVGDGLFAEQISRDSLETAKRNAEKTWSQLKRRDWEINNNIFGIGAPNSRYRFQNKTAITKKLAALELGDIKKLLHETAAQSLAIDMVGPYDSGTARVLALEFAKYRPGTHTTKNEPKATFKAGIHLLDGGSADKVEGAILWPLPAWATKGHFPAYLLPRYFGPDVSDGFDKRLQEHHAREPDWQSNTTLTPDGDFLRYSFRAPLDQVVPILASVKEQLAKLADGHVDREDVLRIRESEGQILTRKFLSQAGLLQVLYWTSMHGREVTDATGLMRQLERVEPADVVALSKSLVFERAVVALRGPAAKLKEVLQKDGMSPVSTTQEDASNSEPGSAQ